MDALDIQLIHASLEQAPIIAQLYELYTYEMTDLADFDINDNGYFGYDELPLYWKDPNRHPYLVLINKKLAGFVLIQKGSPVDIDPDIWDIAEFFIMRRFRKKGIGQFVAHQIWKKFTGRWQVRVWDNNKTAHAFWDAVIGNFAKRLVIPTRREYQGHEGLLIYKFDSPSDTKL
jgi:predicted acetyltransferase